MVLRCIPLTEHNTVQHTTLALYHSTVYNRHVTEHTIYRSACQKKH